MAGLTLKISGFADEATPARTVDEQALVAAACGLRAISVRFVDAGNGPRNVSQLTSPEIKRVRKTLAAHGIGISSIGSPLGKVHLRPDPAGGTYIPWGRYLRGDVERVIARAHRFECPLVRGFSFYPPRHAAPKDHIDEAVDRLGVIAARFEKEGLIYGVEVEANLVGRTGVLTAEICRRIGSRALCSIYDGGNLAAQGMRRKRVMEEFRAMLPSLGWIHVKDYRAPAGMRYRATGWIDEGALDGFVPAGRGDGAYREILAELRRRRASVLRQLALRGIPGLLLEVEPHLRSGGQFAGSSGPDGFGIAVRALSAIVAESDWESDLRDMI